MEIIKEKKLATAIYIAIYNRAPEKSGLDFWSEQIKNGAAYSNVIDGFISHPVFLHKYGNLDNKEKVTAFYHNILGQRGDPAGIDYWTQRLDDGDPLSTVLADFLQSSLELDLSTLSLNAEEFTLASIRQKTLFNKIDVGIFYAEGMGFWGEMRGNAQDLSIQDTSEYQAAADALKAIDHTQISLIKAKEKIEKEHFFFRNPETSPLDDSIGQIIEDITNQINDSTLGQELQKPIEKIPPIEWIDPLPIDKDLGWGDDPFTVEKTINSVTNPNGSITTTIIEIKTNTITGAVSTSISTTQSLSVSSTVNVAASHEIIAEDITLIGQPSETQTLHHADF